MSSTTDFGLVGWDSVEFFDKNSNDRKRDEFIRLQSGDNVVRIVTRPFQYIVHKWKEEGDKGFGDKVYCSMYHGSCPLCALDDKPKQRWFIGVIDRKTQSYKILDMSQTIFKAVQKYNRNEKWGNPGDYDINIVVDKNAGATGYYTVMPEPKTILSDSDIEIKQKADMEALKKRCTPPTPESAQKRVDAIRARKAANTSAVTPDPVERVAPESVAPESVASDSEEYHFPPADASVN